METIGIPKRTLLVRRVATARESQVAAKDQLGSALEQFRTIVSYDGAGLESKYNELQSTLTGIETSSANVKDHINGVETVALAVFRQWEDELEMYKGISVRRVSEQALRETRRQYDEVLIAMRRADSKMEPVVVAMRDNVLFLKHNLNSRSIRALNPEIQVMNALVGAAVKDFDIAIVSADKFVVEMTVEDPVETERNQSGSAATPNRAVDQNKDRRDGPTSYKDRQ